MSLNKTVKTKDMAFFCVLIRTQAKILMAVIHSENPVVHKDNISKLKIFFIFITPMIENEIDLMHDYITRSKFITEPR